MNPIELKKPNIQFNHIDNTKNAKIAILKKLHYNGTALKRQILNITWDDDIYCMSSCICRESPQQAEQESNEMLKPKDGTFLA